MNFIRKRHLGLAGIHGRMGNEIIMQMNDWFELKTTRASAQEPVEDLFQNVDVVIDFSVKEAFLDHLKAAEFFNVPLVVGTTGLTLPQTIPSIPLFISPNMSLAVGVMTSLIEKVVPLFPSFDIEITEEHHRHKKDSPSGTALMLGASVAAARKIPFKIAIDRTGEREENVIGFSAIRAGKLPGEHTIHFIGEEERFSFSHVCYTRAVFARGALEVANWLVDKAPGLYTMRDFETLH